MRILCLLFIICLCMRVFRVTMRSCRNNIIYHRVPPYHLIRAAFRRDKHDYIEKQNNLTVEHRCILIKVAGG